MGTWEDDLPEPEEEPFRAEPEGELAATGGYLEEAAVVVRSGITADPEQGAW